MFRRPPSNYCSFHGCDRNSNSEGIHLFRFPKDECRCQSWVEASKNVKLVGVPAVKLNASARVCNSHFQDWCFMNPNQKKRLVHNAIPNSPKPCRKEQEKTPSDSECSTHSNSNDDISNSTSSLLAQLLLASPVSPQATNTNTSTVGCTSACKVLPSIATSTPAQPSTSACLPPFSSPISAVASSQTTQHNDRCDTPRSRKYSPQTALLAKMLKRQKDSARKLKRKLAALRKSIKDAKKQSLKHTLLKQGVNENLSTFIARQVKLSLQKDKGKRYTQYDKNIAYQIFSKSQSAYHLLRKFLYLPSPCTLQRFNCSSLSVPGIDADVK